MIGEDSIISLGTKGSESKKHIIRSNQTHKFLGSSINTKHSKLTKRSRPTHELRKNDAATTTIEIISRTLTSPLS
jgi:hypothetical protein